MTLESTCTKVVLLSGKYCPHLDDHGSHRCDPRPISVWLRLIFSSSIGRSIRHAPADVTAVGVDRELLGASECLRQLSYAEAHLLHPIEAVEEIERHPSALALGDLVTHEAVALEVGVAKVVVDLLENGSARIRAEALSVWRLRR